MEETLKNQEVNKMLDKLNPINIAKNTAKGTAKGVGRAIYGLGRALGWLGYTGVPAYAYFKSKDALDWVDSFASYNPIGWFVKLFGWDDIYSGRKINELSENGIGLAAAGLASKGINNVTEKVMPYNHNIRNLVETGLNGAGAVAVNGLAHSEGFKNALESMVYSVSSKEAFADSVNRTIAEGIGTLQNLGNNTDYTTLNNILYAASAGMLAMAGYRIFEILDRNIFDALPIRKIRDSYVERKADRARKAKKK